MAVSAEVDISKRGDLEKWLKGKPNDLVQAVVARLALRILPMANRATKLETFDKFDFSSFLLAVFRANTLAWASRRYPFIDMTAAARMANTSVSAYAANSRTASIASISASAASSRAAASRAAAIVSISVAYATDVADSYTATAILGSVSNDINSVVQRENAAVDLISKPLWFEVRMPEPIEVAWIKCQQAMNELNEGWEVWINWYEDRLHGRESNEESELARAIISDTLWKQGARAVNEHIQKFTSRSVPNAPKKKSSSRIKSPEPESPHISSPTFISSTETAFISDTPDPALDYLNRVELAFVLAGRINQIWDRLNLEPSLRQAEPESGFVIHVDAPWGGGKTSFTNFLTRILNPYRERGPLPTWHGKLLEDEKNWPERNRRPWHIVHFNAWQHQHVKPPWWVFYQTIYSQVSKAMVSESYNVHPNNGMPPIPKGEFSYPSRLDRFCLRLACWLREMAWRLWTPDFKFKLAITVFVSAAIYTLTSYGWLSFDLSKPDQPADVSKLPAILSAMAVVVFGGGSAIWTIISAMTSSLLPGTPNAAENYSAGAGDPLDRFRTHFATMMEFFHRPILVVVDDLDRCEPEFVVELIRGMQTIMKSKRVIYVLLGDRDWITQSFTNVNENMKGIDVGPEHEFGQRFVEKAIQFSFVLPEITDEERQVYVRKLLNITESSLLKPEATLEIEIVRADFTTILDEPDNFLREEQAKNFRTTLTAKGISDSVKSALNAELDRQLSLRAAADKTTDTATQHRLEGISHVLPANPRQIKRIINTISFIQEVARLEQRIQPGDDKWQMLARWIVLMVEWPKTWYSLSKEPGLIDSVLTSAKQKKPIASLIGENTKAMALLDFKPVKGFESGWKKQKIDSKSVTWLIEILPPTSGESLTPPVRHAEI
jgi:hypothetical protein